MKEPFESVAKLVHWRISESGDAQAFQYREGDRWVDLTWNQFGDRVREVANGLHALGLAKGDRVGILSNTRMEWVTCDIATLCAGAAVSTIYPSNTPDECHYILDNSGSRFCFAEDDVQVAKLAEVRAQLPELAKVIVIDGSPSPDGWVLTLDELVTLGRGWAKDHPDAYQERADAVGPDDLATLIYTSGTTGRPKGVMLTHDNWCFTAESVDEVAQDFQEPGDRQYLFLPLSHSFGKILEFIAIRSGVPTAVHGDIQYILPGLKEVGPTFMGAVPRVFEKVFNKIVQDAKAKGDRAYGVFTWSVGVGSEVARLRMAGQEPGLLLRLKYWLAYRLVFSKLKAAFGGNLRSFMSGGAPLAKEIAEFFYAADILILEGYGLTESSAASFTNRFRDFRFGTVGMPNPGVEVKIADDGEILMRGRGIMKGYYNLPEATAEAIEPDGWFHTGDIGVLDDGGFLRITGRKKELIITAGGKNIAPAHFENMLKARSNYVSQVVMHGDRRNFCVALVTINEESVGHWAKQQGIAFTDYADLASKQEVHDLIWADVEACNAELASYETIKYIKLLPADFSVETGELTPTMKVKRRVVEDTYKHLLDGFYAGTMQEMSA